MSGQRTEAATPRRRAEARRRGNVPRSPDLVASASLLVGVLVASITVPHAGRALADHMAATLSSLPAVAGDPDAFRAVFIAGATAGARLLGPVMLAMAVTGVTLTMVQTGGLFTLKPLGPDLDRINPLRGFQRLFSLRALAEATKGSVKVAAVAVVVVAAIRPALPELAATTGERPDAVLRVLGATAMRLLLRGGVALLVIGLLDYVYQRFEWERGLRMTKEEVREDLRESEGDPLVRSRQRGRQRDLARRRMMSDVPRATVVVTNPTRIAVALRYVPNAMAAPTVVAKGTRLVAERIRAIAAQHRVPIVENRPLAQALYKSVAVGRQIPPALYRAVAEVLATIYRLSRQRSVLA